MQNPQTKSFANLKKCPFPSGRDGTNNNKRTRWMDGWLDARFKYKYGALPIVAAIVFAWCGISYGQTFGLGIDESTTIETCAPAEMFGLVELGAPPTLGEPVFADPAPVAVLKRSRSVEKSYQSPAGFHRHVKRDGTVIEHHDSNFGDPVAHAGIDRPWPKYYGPLAPETKTTTTVTVQRAASSCPGGVCPSPGIQTRGFLRRRFR